MSSKYQQKEAVEGVPSSPASQQSTKRSANCELLLTDKVSLNYAGEGMPTICHQPLYEYKDESWALPQPGRPSVLPKEFTDTLVDWVCARRALKYAVFGDDFHAVTIEFCWELITSCTSSITKAWDVSFGTIGCFRNTNKHRIGTKNQRPVEIDRARWATSENVQRWHEMLADSLDDAGVAVENPDFDSKADPQTREAQPVILLSQTVSARLMRHGRKWT